MKLFVTTVIVFLALLRGCGHAGGASSSPILHYIWEPLPIGMLDNLDNLPEGAYVSITYGDFSPTSNPGKNLGMSLRYFPEEKIQGLGCSDDVEDLYAYDFTSVQEFLDLIDYIQQYPDTFFDYAEFNGSNPYILIRPEGMVKWLQLMIKDYRDQNGVLHGYAIGEGFLEDDQRQEVQHVFDVLETDFLAEIVQHPYEIVEPEIPNEPPE